MHAVSTPIAARAEMATEPTPPVAPSTITGPFLGARPFSSMRMTAKAAVKPAVPSAIASQAVMPGGNACSQSPGRRAYSA